MALSAISPQSLVDFIRAREESRGAEMNCEVRQYSAACAVLRTWLGKKWVQRRVALKHPYFEQPTFGLGTDHFRAASRIVKLAEMLLNMQHVDGIELRLPRLRNGSLWADVAELEGAAILQRAGIPYRFVKETSAKGMDFDVEAIIGDVIISCEMKAKLESTPPTLQAFLKKLKEGRYQVPIATPNVLFVKPPEIWMMSKQGYDAINDGLRRFFELSDHFASVVIHAEEWRTLGQGGAMVTHRHIVHMNPRPRMALPGSADSSKDWLSYRRGDWMGIDEVVCGPERRKLIEQVRGNLKGSMVPGGIDGIGEKT